MVEKKDKSNGEKNNIGAANVVILKRQIIEEAEDNTEDYIYPVPAAIWSQKRNIKAKKFQLTSRVIKAVGRDSEKTVTNQISKNQDQLDNRNIRSTFLFPLPFEDEEIEDSATIKGDSYGMRGALHPGQDRQVQFGDQDDGVYDILESRHYLPEENTSSTQAAIG